VIANGAASAAESIALVAAAPGIVNGTSGAATARHADQTAVSDAAPARPGEYITILLAGMGATDVAVAAGAIPSEGTVVRPSIIPVVTLNGTSSEVRFAGLTSSVVGLYQVEFKVPDGAASGSAKLVVTQGGTASNAVTLPVAR